MLGNPEAKDRLPVDTRPGFRKRPKNRGSRGRRGSMPWMIEMRTARCHYCGGPGGTLDHIIPYSQGGKTVPNNCVPACWPCNNFRGDKPYREFKDFGWKNRPFVLGI